MYRKNKKNHGEYEFVVYILNGCTCVVLTLYTQRRDCLCPGCE